MHDSAMLAYLAGAAAFDTVPHLRPLTHTRDEVKSRSAPKFRGLVLQPRWQPSPMIKHQKVRLNHHGSTHTNLTPKSD